jgi:ATP-dependent helicase/nuclease subunit A
VTIEPVVTAEDIERRVTWSYPHQAASAEPAKTTVSTLRHRQHELDSEGVPLFRGKLRPSKAPAAAFSPPDRKSLSATERGTLHHLFLQWMDLGHADSLLDLQNEGERLCRSGVFTRDELLSIRFSTLAAFWHSELGMQIRKFRDRVQRELPFTARLSMADLRNLGVIRPDLALIDEEFVVVQGQVDLAVVLKEEIWLLDFKTDAVALEDVPGRAKHYEVQIRIYARALEVIYKRPVTHRWLHFLTVDQTVALSR